MNRWGSVYIAFAFVCVREYSTASGPRVSYAVAIVMDCEAQA